MADDIWAALLNSSRRTTKLNVDSADAAAAGGSPSVFN
jgi:hypothetical protein